MLVPALIASAVVLANGLPRWLAAATPILIVLPMLALQPVVVTSRRQALRDGLIGACIPLSMLGAVWLLLKLGARFA